ncbi:MAG: helix-hairpin-helix domain-containing protein [Candidatus Poribacteria bacterium]|nr:helix-hairpin-helix domain-containing protein [Candidatus Poribacteria bacterium]
MAEVKAGAADKAVVPVVKRRFNQRFGDDKGLSLVATLWIMAVLSILATEYLYTVMLDRKMAENIVSRTQVEFAAKAGIAQFIRTLAADETPQDSTDDEWAQQIENEILDPTVTTKTHPYTVTATDEAAKINANTATQANLQSVLQSAGAGEQAQTLSQAIVDARGTQPFRTIGDLARVEGMTTNILYGAATTTPTATTGAPTQQSTPLINLLTVYSVDKNERSGGEDRVNITSADANAIRDGLTLDNGSQALSDEEADAFVQYRDNNTLDSIGDLLDVALPSQKLDGFRNQLSTDGQNNTVNINTADANALGNVNGIDQGLGESIVRYRNANGNFGSVDNLTNVTLLTRDEIKQVIDKATITDDDTIEGLVNINTASVEVLGFLSNMDPQKAQAIIDARANTAQQQGAAQAGQQQQSSGFTNIGALLDIQQIDDDTFQQIAGQITYRAQVFRVEAAGQDQNGQTLTTIIAVLDRSGDEVTTRYWRVN